MKKILLLFLLIKPLFLVSQTIENSTSKKISGFIFHKKNPLEGATISVNKTDIITKSNSMGFYEIKAKVGDTINFDYTDLKRKLILIEDVTNTLNINLKIEDKKPKLKQNKFLKLGGSIIGSSLSYLDILPIKGQDLNKNAETLTQAILEKTSAFHAKQNSFGENILYIKGKELDGPVVWDIDGFLYDIPIPVFIDEVVDIVIINSQLTGCVIQVNTDIDYSKVNDINYDDYYFSDVDYYNYDATLYKHLIKYSPDYLNDFKNITNPKKALNIYLTEHSKYKNDIDYLFNIINYFEKKYKTPSIILEILSNYEQYAANNPEALKAIAYKYQELNENEKALEVYKKITKLRPNHAQSFRDLANTFLDLKDDRNKWLTYKYYLNKGFKIENNDIGDIISSEIINSYNNDAESKTYQKIKINDGEIVTKIDVRLVFEWNTSEAEFKIEFVNPEEQVYEIENSIDTNNNLIIDQKKKGYTSKEILIEDLREGDWLVNFTYLGNKQYKPTILKVTTYYNWGKPNQSKKINVFDFTIQNIKTQLIRLNKNQL